MFFIVSDINECDQNPCTAGRICVNTVGSYTCSHGGVSHITPDIPERGYDLVPTEEICPPGFRLHPEIADCVGNLFFCWTIAMFKFDFNVI